MDKESRRKKKYCRVCMRKSDRGYPQRGSRAVTVGGLGVGIVTMALLALSRTVPTGS